MQNERKKKPLFNNILLVLMFVSSQVYFSPTWDQRNNDQPPGPHTTSSQVASDKYSKSLNSQRTKAASALSRMRLIWPLAKSPCAFENSIHCVVPIFFHIALWIVSGKFIMNGECHGLLMTDQYSFKMKTNMQSILNISWEGSTRGHWLLV